MIQTIEATPPDLHSGQIEVIQALNEHRFLKIMYFIIFKLIGLIKKMFIN